MTDYYNEEYFEQAKKQKKGLTIQLFISIAVFVAISSVLVVWFLRLPYGSNKVSLVKWIHYGVVAVFIVYLSIFLGIPYKRVRKFCKLCQSFSNGLTREYYGEFVGVDSALSVREGVDTYYLEFREYNKDKDTFFIRKVSVLAEKEIPDFDKGDKVRYFTHNNFLMKYEIREKSHSNEKE